MNNQTNYRHSKTSILPSHILYVSLAFVLLNFIDVGIAQAAHIVKSPDGNIVVTFDVKDVGDQRGCPVYGVSYKNRPIIVDSHLGFAFKDASALEAAQMAETGWVRVMANMNLGANEVYTATADHPDPDWPELSFSDILKIAFKGHYISEYDHPVIRRLRGEL